MTYYNYNEERGSSVQAYGTYEYFHKQVPSLLYPVDMSQIRRSFRLFDHGLTHLTSFDITAVFPINRTSAMCYFLYVLYSLQLS